jgi:DNA helicase II / ATP-dependent DNA helicase PcrA
MSTSTLLRELNEPQRRAVTTTHGPILILAGAGTGKTRVITNRIAHLIEQGTNGEHILGVTFTNKAATEMRERLTTLAKCEDAEKVTLSTFHALCVLILRRSIDRLGYKNNFTIYDESDQSGLIRKIIGKIAGRDEKLDVNLAKHLISRAKNSLEFLRDQDAFRADEASLMGAVFARYQQELKNLNAVDFDDLLLLSVQLFRQHQDVRERWQRRFQFIMVDEFQDTNGLQLELVDMLSGESRNVCVVGDDDQSIYGWRGAQLSNILEFEQRFPNSMVIKLEQNYRSTNTILSLANSLIRNNPSRRAKQLWSDHKAEERARLVYVPDDRKEAEFVAGEIQQRKQEDNFRWEDFAVLYRTNIQSRVLEEVFRRLEIPYRLVGGKSFFDRRETRDLLAYTGCLLNPDDDVRLLRIINTPARGISSPVIEAAIEKSIRDKHSIFAVLQSSEFLGSISSRVAAAINEFVELLGRYMSAIAAGDFAATMSRLITEIGYLEDLRRSCRSADEALNREMNANAFCDALRAHEEQGGTLQQFVDTASLDPIQERNDGHGVTLITLHAAKGLEFRHVYLISLEEGLLPHDRARLEGTIDEERRLLYVGITRAMRTLTLTCCSGRQKFGKLVPSTPSSFLKELSPELIEEVDQEALANRIVPHNVGRSKFAAMRAAVERSGAL